MTVVVAVLGGLAALGLLAVVFLRSLAVLERGQREGWRAIREGQVSAAESVGRAVERASGSVGAAVAEALGPGRREDPRPEEPEPELPYSVEDLSDGWDGLVGLSGPGVVMGSYEDEGAPVPGGPDHPPEAA